MTTPVTRIQYRMNTANTVTNKDMHTISAESHWRMKSGIVMPSGSMIHFPVVFDRNKRTQKEHFMCYLYAPLDITGYLCMFVAEYGFSMHL